MGPVNIVGSDFTSAAAILHHTETAVCSNEAEDTETVDMVGSEVTSAAIIHHTETAVCSNEADVTETMDFVGSGVISTASTIDTVISSDMDDSLVDVEYVPPSTDSDSLSNEIPFVAHRFIRDTSDVAAGAGSICHDNACQSATAIDGCSQPADVDNDVSLNDPPSPKVTVFHASNASNAGQRLYDKKHFCFYCHLAFLHLPRHLYSVHSSESAVAEIMAVQNRDRKMTLLTRLRNMGNALHNRQVKSDNCGSLRVVYRPSKPTKTGGKDYVPCQFCYGYYARKQLWRHCRRCKLKPGTSVSKVKPVTAGDLLSLEDVPDSVKSLISGMRKDKLHVIIKNDRVMQLYAAKLLERVSHSKEHTNYIRARLRKLARLLQSIRKRNTTLRDADLKMIVLNPKHFRTVLSCVKDVALYNPDDHVYGSPSIALHLGHALNKCAVIVKNIGLQEEDQSSVHKAQAFADLCSSEWNDEIAGGARRSLKNRKFNKPLLLPLASDIFKLASHLKEVQEKSVAGVQKRQYDSEFARSFRSLSQCLLAQLILFNRRRQGEVSKLLISVYKAHSSESQRDDDEANAMLSPLERQLMHKLHRVEIPGKRNNVVPILFTSSQKTALDLLIDPELRGYADISMENVFVFATTKASQGHIRGNDVLRAFATQCNAVNPNLLQSTTLRKHIATLSQVLNLTTHELDQLAKFMGHDIRVHREFYRLPSDVIQTAKVAKILLAMERGEIGKYKGKGLEEIEIGPDDGKLCQNYYCSSCKFKS